MFGLTFGEIFVVTFILVMVVSAPYWPRAGEAVAAALSRSGPKPASGSDVPPSGKGNSP